MERAYITGGTRVTGHIVEKHRKLQGGGPYGDAYEIVIAYRAQGRLRFFKTSRAVWDRWGTLNTVGAAVPVLYLNSGRAFINRFNYLYPVTTMLLAITVTAAGAFLFLLVMPRSRIESDALRTAQYRQLKSRRRRHPGRHRRFLLRRLQRILLMFAAALGLVIIGVIRSSLWLLVAGFAVTVLLTIALRRKLVCPHCRASLYDELKNIVPQAGSGTNWLMVRDYLAKGVPLTCGHCGRSLDE